MKICVLTHLRNLIPRKALLQLYKSAVLPNLYLLLYYLALLQVADTRKLERVQERALRAVFSNKTAAYEELLNWAGCQAWRIVVFKIF